MAQYGNGSGGDLLSPTLAQAGGGALPAAPSSASATGSHNNVTPSQQQQQQPQHKRVYQACIPCRRRKVRCDLGTVDNPHDPPCARCRRESKECYFSATRRKRKTEDDDLERASGEDEYIVRNGRKRLHASTSPPPLDKRLFSETPLTPGGSLGRAQPLRRPDDHARSESRSSLTAHTSRGRSAGEFGGEEPNTPLENFEARSVMRGQMYGPHDALDLLYKAATDGKHDGAGHHAHSTSQGQSIGITPQPRNAAMGRIPQSDGMDYAHAAVNHPGQMDAPIDPQLKTEPENDSVHTEALKAWARFRFVRAGWFTAQEAIDYIDYYYKFLSPLTPISPPTFQDPVSHLTLLTEEPILAVTLLTIASRYRKMPGIGGKCRSYAIHEQLWTYLRGMIERVVWGQEAFGGGFCGSGADESQASSTAPWRGVRKGSLRTLGTIESLMILTEWHPRALHFPPSEAIDELMLPSYDSLSQNSNGGDANQRPLIGMGGKRIESWLEPAWRSDRMCWMLLTTAMGLGYELGVFDNIDELLEAGTISRPEYEEETYRLRAYRIKRLTLIYLSQLAGRLGWTNMVPENLRKSAATPRRRPASSIAVDGTTPGTNISSLSTPFNYIPDLELDDQIIHCWAGISNAMHTGNEKLFKSREHTTEIIQTGKYIDLLKEFQPMLRDWRKEFDLFRLPPYIRHILTIEYEYVRIYVNSLSLQAVVERCTSNAAGTTVAAPTAPGFSTYGMQLSPKTQEVYNKMPLTQLGGFNPADQEYVREVVEGSRNLLRTVVEGLLPGDYLKHAPVRTYFRIISGAMFLLKTFALGATRSDVEQSIMLMDSTVNALRTCVVDDVHLGIRFADLLDNLTSRLRHRFIHAVPPTQPASMQAVSIDGRSPMPENGTNVGLGPNGHNELQVNGHDQGTWAKLREGGAMQERSYTPTANISATPFDLTLSNFPMPTFGRPPTPALHNASGAMSGGDNNAAANNNLPDLFTHDGDWNNLASDMLYLPPGAAFFQHIGGEGPSIGMNAEGINVGGVDLLDYMVMDHLPGVDGNYS